MKQFPFITIFLFTFSFSYSQDDSHSIDINSYEQPFIYLTDGTLLLEKDFFIKKRILFGDLFYDMDGNKINIREIKYLRFEDKLAAVYSQSYSQRIENGKINIYKQYSSSGGHYDSRGNFRSGSSTKTYLYSSGFEDLKHLSYKNLKKDLSVFPDEVSKADQKVVLDILQKGRKRDKTRLKLILTGVGVFAVGGIINQLGENEEGVANLYSKNEKIGLAISVVGLGISITGLVLKDERVFYINSVKEYNKLFN
jgi:hypothetical protein